MTDEKDDDDVYLGIAMECEPIYEVIHPSEWKRLLPLKEEPKK